MVSCYSNGDVGIQRICYVYVYRPIYTPNKNRTEKDIDFTVAGINKNPGPVDTSQESSTKLEVTMLVSRLVTPSLAYNKMPSSKTISSLKKKPGPTINKLGILIQKC